MGCIVDLFSHDGCLSVMASVGYVPVRMSLSAIVIMLKTQITTLINLPLFGSTHCTSGAFVCYYVAHASSCAPNPIGGGGERIVTGLFLSAARAKRTGDEP